MKSNRNVTAFLWLLSVVLGALAILLTFNRVRTFAAAAARSELHHQMELANQEQIPLTSKELLGKPIPENENAASLYIAAGEKLDAELKSVQRPNSSALPGAQPPTYEATPYGIPRPEKQSELNRCYVAAAPAMALYKKAAQLPACDFHEDPADALFEPNTNLDRMTAAVALAVGEVRRLAAAGHPKDAMNLLASFAPIAAHIGTTPTPFHTLIAISTNRLLLENAFKILSGYGRQPGVPKATEHFLQALGPLPDLVRNAEGENLCELSLIQPKFLLSDRPVSTGDKTTDESAARLGHLARRPGMIDSWRAAQIQSTRELVATLKSIGDNWSGTEQRAADGFVKYMTGDNSHAYMREDNVAEMWRETIDKDALCLTQRRILAQVAATFEAWNRTGKVPEALPLVGPESRDPLGNCPLHYKRKTIGFKLYGVGPYGVDHGGKRPRRGQHDQDYDVVFTYPAPAN